MATVILNIPQIIGTNDCVALADGQKVHDEIANNLRAGNVIHVSFAGVRSIITAFLNAAIGQLYGDFKDDVIAKNLFLVDAKPEDAQKVKRVVDGAKLYFKDKKKFEASQRDVMGGND